MYEFILLQLSVNKKFWPVTILNKLWANEFL